MGAAINTSLCLDQKHQAHPSSPSHHTSPSQHQFLVTKYHAEPHIVMALRSQIKGKPTVNPGTKHKNAQFREIPAPVYLHTSRFPFEQGPTARKFLRSCILSGSSKQRDWSTPSASYTRHRPPTPVPFSLWPCLDGLQQPKLPRSSHLGETRPPYSRCRR
jgi:hypothetical protein